MSTNLLDDKLKSKPNLIIRLKVQCLLANLFYMYLTWNSTKSINSYGDSSTETIGLPSSGGSTGTSAGGS